MVRTSEKYTKPAFTYPLNTTNGDTCIFSTATATTTTKKKQLN